MNIELKKTLGWNLAVYLVNFKMCHECPKIFFTVYFSMIKKLDIAVSPTVQEWLNKLWYIPIKNTMHLFLKYYKGVFNNAENIENIMLKSHYETIYRMYIIIYNCIDDLRCVCVCIHACMWERVHMRNIFYFLNKNYQNI